MTKRCVPDWQPIETLLSVDDYVLLYLEEQGRLHLTRLTHDDTFEWWARQGFTHWCMIQEPNLPTPAPSGPLQTGAVA